MSRLKIGTRGSKLALVQAGLVAGALQKLEPDLQIETVIIKTEGDRNMAPIPLDTVGKAWFTAEIDRALTSREIDLAAHSLKDLPLEPTPGLALRMVLPRDDPRDVVVARTGAGLDALPAGSIVGTDSTRRRALILHRRPDLKVISLRGNVQTRLRKLQDGDYDAIVLAAAGLVRLGELNAATEMLDPTQFIPATGQGTLAVEVREDDHSLIAKLKRLTDQDTVIAAEAERTYSAAIGGGCKLPVGCYAEVTGGTVQLHGLIAELDGPGILIETAHGPAANANALASELAASMLRQCTFNFQPGEVSR